MESLEGFFRLLRYPIKAKRQKDAEVAVVLP